MPRHSTPLPTLPMRPSGQLAPWARRFVPWFSVTVMLAIVAVLVPTWLGADPDLVLAIIPLASWMPALIAIVLLLVLRKPVPIRRALAVWPLRPAGRLWRSMGLMALALVLVPAVTIAVTVATGIVRFEPAEGVAMTALMLVPLVPIMMLQVLGEELGWRGALQTALAPWGWWRSSVAIGVLWTLWHAPLLVTYVATGSMTTQQAVITSVNLLLVSILLGAARAASGSVWPAVLGHAMLNTVLVFATSNITTPLASLSETEQWLQGAAGWGVWLVVIAIVAARMRRRGQAADALGAPAADTHGARVPVASHGRLAA